MWAGRSSAGSVSGAGMQNNKILFANVLKVTDRSQFPFSCGIYGAIVVKVAVKYNFMDLDRSVLNLWTMSCDGERIGSGNVQGN